MPCFHPLIGQQPYPGAKVSFSGLSADLPYLTVPCGRCFGCRLDRSQQWAVRCMGEAQTAGPGQSWFGTFTYSPEHLPAHGSLDPRDHTLFMKKLRHEYPGVRFFMAGEYGDQKNPATGFGRPHFHYLFFGMPLKDAVPLSGSSRNPFFSSESLTRIWGKGFVHVGLVTYETAAYVAGYVQKKRMGKDAAEFYRVVDAETGETWSMHPEFQRQSLKPGIGSEWFARYHGDVFPADKVPLKSGRFSRVPKYFETLYERLRAEDSSLPALDVFKEKRRERSIIHAEDFTDARLKVREACAIAKRNFYAKRAL